MTIRLINIGESGHGKTGALASLCAAGFKVRVLDLENGIETLVNLLVDPASKYPKEAINNLRWITLTESRRVINGAIVPRAATQWPKLTAMLEQWRGDFRFDREAFAKTGQYEDGIVKCEDSLGSIYSWNASVVLCIDTLTSAALAAVNHKLMLEGKLGAPRSSMESMRDAGSSQGMIMNLLGFFADASLKCNVVINTHLNWAKEDGRHPEVGYEGTLYGFPSAIGKALNLQLGRNFNHIIMTQRRGIEQRIYTRDVPNVALKSGAPLRVKASYPLVTSLADYFADVNGYRGPRVSAAAPPPPPAEPA